MTAPTRPRWRPTPVPGTALLVALVGVLASTGLGGLLAADQERTEDRLVDQRTAAMQAAVTSEARRYVETLTTLAAGAGTLPEVTADSFDALTAPVGEMDLPGATGIAFVVATTSAEVADVQAAWQARGVTDLHLRPYLHDDDHLFTVLQRSLGATLAPAGLDLAASSQATAALLRGRELSTVAVSRPYELLTDRYLPADQRQQSFLITAPVRSPGTGTAPGDFRGWLVMAMHGEDFVGRTLQDTAEGQVHAALLAEGGDGWTHVAGDRLAVATASDIRRTAPITIADQQWLLEAGAHRTDLPGGGNRLARAVGAAGLLLTAVSTVLALVLTTDRRRAERQVEVATRDLRHAQEEAQRQAGLLKAVMDSLGDGVAVVDAGGRYLMSNRASRTILGLGDVDGPDPWQADLRFHGPDGRTPLPVEDMPLVRALAGETVDDVEVLVRSDARPEGLWLEVSARPLDPRTGQSGAVAVFHDVTARRAADEASRRAEALFRDLLEAAPDAIVGCDEAGTVVFANSKVDELFGYRREELLGRSLDVLVPDAVRPDHAAHRATYLRDPVARPMSAMQLSARRKDGSLFPAEISLSTLQSEDGLIVSAAVRDVSERVRAQEELQRLNRALRDLNIELELRVHERTSQLEQQAEALREVNAELEAFSYSVSHDLRAPLRAVDGFAAVLAMDHADQLDDAGRRYLDRVRSGAQQMGRLIDGLLSFSRLQRQDMTYGHVPMAALLDEVWEELAVDRAGRDVTLHVGHLPPAEGDPRLMRHVLANLVGNAVKYTRGREHARIEVGSRVDDDGAPVYVVRDNGTGFDMRYADKLFKVFQRLHRAEDYEGTGIGLALTSRIIARHGGRIWADAEPDRGATFLFTLPVAEAADATDPTTAGASVAAAATALAAVPTPTRTSR